MPQDWKQLKSHLRNVRHDSVKRIKTGQKPKFGCYGILTKLGSAYNLTPAQWLTNEESLVHR